MKRKFRAGFTLIEVALFLAISGALVAGIISGTNHSMARQRYNNSVEEFKDFLTSLYSRVMYTQSSESGRSTTAIYGKLVIFGMNNANEVVTYSVTGNVLSNQEINDLGNLTTLEALSTKTAGGKKGVDIKVDTNSKESVALKWGMEILGVSPTFIKKQVALLIVRSPISGAVSTFNYEYNSSGEIIGIINGSDELRKAIANDDFLDEQVDFCLDSEDRWAAGNFRRNIRINQNAYNASAIEIISDDAGDNKCVE